MYLFVYLFIYLFVYLFLFVFCLFIYLSIYLFIYLFEEHQNLTKQIKTPQECIQSEISSYNLQSWTKYFLNEVQKSCRIGLEQKTLTTASA